MVIGDDGTQPLSAAWVPLLWGTSGSNQRRLMPLDQPVPGFTRCQPQLHRVMGHDQRFFDFWVAVGVGLGTWEGEFGAGLATWSGGFCIQGL